MDWKHSSFPSLLFNSSRYLGIISVCPSERLYDFLIPLSDYLTIQSVHLNASSVQLDVLSACLSCIRGVSEGLLGYACVDGWDGGVCLVTAGLPPLASFRVGGIWMVGVSSS